MVNFETLNEVASFKDSDDVVQKVNEILSFISDKGGKGKINNYSLVLKDDVLTFSLSVTIPIK